jgi:hypothetical protein
MTADCSGVGKLPEAAAIASVRAMGTASTCGARSRASRALTAPIVWMRQSRACGRRGSAPRRAPARPPMTCTAFSIVPTKAARDSSSKGGCTGVAYGAVRVCLSTRSFAPPGDDRMPRESRPARTRAGRRSAAGSSPPQRRRSPACDRSSGRRSRRCLRRELDAVDRPADDRRMSRPGAPEGSARNAVRRRGGSFRRRGVAEYREPADESRARVRSVRSIQAASNSSSPQRASTAAQSASSSARRRARGRRG